MENRFNLKLLRLSEFPSKHSIAVFDHFDRSVYFTPKKLALTYDLSTHGSVYSALACFLRIEGKVYSLTRFDFFDPDGDSFSSLGWYDFLEIFGYVDKAFEFIGKDLKLIAGDFLSRRLAGFLAVIDAINNILKSEEPEPKIIETSLVKEMKL